MFLWGFLTSNITILLILCIILYDGKLDFKFNKSLINLNISESKVDDIAIANENIVYVNIEEVEEKWEVDYEENLFKYKNGEISRYDMLEKFQELKIYLENKSFEDEEYGNLLKNNLNEMIVLSNDIKNKYELILKTSQQLRNEKMEYTIGSR